MSTEGDRTRARVARKVMGLIDPATAARHRRGIFVTNRVEPFPVQDVAGTKLLADAMSEAPGIDFRRDEQLARLAAWVTRGPSVFEGIRRDPAISPHGIAGEPITNSYYDTPDAEVYFSMIADLAPGRIVEIGGGFSTLVARAAIEENGLSTQLVVIDPEPRTDVRQAADDVMLRRVEAVAQADLQLSADDILFIDSSHVLRTGGDLQHLFLEVIPRLAAGTHVHVHDIFLPYGYSSEFAQRMWTEQYVLQALLSGSARYEVVFATHLMSRQHPAEMRAAFGPTVATTPRQHGQSFWFKVRST